MSGLLRALSLSVAVALAGVVAAAGCGARCVSSSDCDPGELCNFDEGSCVQGCQSNDQCFSRNCDRETGLCRPKRIFIPDLDSGTSTVTDAATSTRADGG